MVVNTLTVKDVKFPSSLKEIAYPPRQLYWTGRDPAEWLNSPKVAIVGSRKMTAYGQAVTTNLATELAEAGVVIISGLAFGIDITAHQAALAAQGTTVAVLASGLDNITPRSNYYIAEKIIQSGTLMSERPLQTPVHPGLFVARNRIISGLADIVLIPEAALKSGSLHTARFALEQGKTVMAVPGNITNPFSEGCNNLIKSGAVPVTSVNDVLFALKIGRTDKKTVRIHATPQEELVFGFIQEGVTSQEEIALASKLEGQELASVLTMLELAGHIRPAGGGNWVTS